LVDQARHHARTDRRRQAAAEWASRAGPSDAQGSDGNAARRKRPDDALGQKTPASLYEPSPRPYPNRLDDPSYGGDVAVRRGRSNGQIKWAGEVIFVGEALIGWPVGGAE